MENLKDYINFSGVVPDDFGCRAVTERKRRCSMGKRILWIGLVSLAVVALMFFVAAASPSGAVGKSKGQYATDLGTTSVAITADSGYVFTHLVIINDDSTNNLFIEVGDTSIAGTGGSTADFFLKPAETIQLDVLASVVTVEASGASTDYRFFALEARP